MSGQAGTEDSVTLILGDNIFYGAMELESIMADFDKAATALPGAGSVLYSARERDAVGGAAPPEGP